MLLKSVGLSEQLSISAHFLSSDGRTSFSIEAMNGCRTNALLNYFCRMVAVYNVLIRRRCRHYPYLPITLIIVLSISVTTTGFLSDSANPRSDYTTSLTPTAEDLKSSDRDDDVINETNRARRSADRGATAGKSGILSRDATGCSRVPGAPPGEEKSEKTPGDNGFRITIAGRPPPERYTAGQVYTVILDSTYSNQQFVDFYLVAVPQHAKDESTAIGTFQHLDASETSFLEQCQYPVVSGVNWSSYGHGRLLVQPKSKVELLWTAPSARTGCLEFRTTVVVDEHVWFKDDGALTKQFCEETGTTENNLPLELLPECCACDTAKYQMTFQGLWSHRTHAKDFPLHRQSSRWSHVVGASHSKHYMIWQYGALASRGVREICELGRPHVLEEEMRQHSDAVRTVVKTPGIQWSEQHGLEQVRWAHFSVDKKNHLLSILSKFAPSPDWCVGVSALNLCLPNCSWAGDITMKLFPWDAGSNDGVSYLSPDTKNGPTARKIHRITNTFPASADSPFFGPDTVSPMAVLKVKRIHPRPYDDHTSDCSGRVEHSDDVGLHDADLSSGGHLKLFATGDDNGATGEYDRTEQIDGETSTFADEVTSRKDDEFTPSRDSHEDYNGKDADRCAMTAWSEWSTCSRPCPPCAEPCGLAPVRHRQRTYQNPGVDVDSVERACEKTTEEEEECTLSFNASPSNLECNRSMTAQVMTTMKVINDVCAQSMDVGSCHGSFLRWYYDVTSRRCVTFHYGGCRGNDNRFRSHADCTRLCVWPWEKTGEEEGKGNEFEDESRIHKRLNTTQMPFELHEVTSATTSSSFTTRPFPVRAVTDWNALVTQFHAKAASTRNESWSMAGQQLQRSTPYLLTKDWLFQTTIVPKKLTNDTKTHLIPTLSTWTRPVNSRNDTVHCMMTSWSTWSRCSVTCGPHGSRSRTRTVKIEPRGSGKACPHRRHQSQKCLQPQCIEVERGRRRSRVNCVLSDWSPWSPCAATCGSDVIQERVRRVISPFDTSHAGQDDTKCNIKISRRICLLPQCPTLLRPA